MDDYVYEEINIGGKRRNVSLGLYMKERLYNSPRIEVYDSDAFGRCLYLDGALQTTEKDEHIYHETLVHTALLKVTPRNVLIIGGGDGGTLREVLKHKNRGLKRVVMVEINPEVVEVSKKFLPTFELEESLKDSMVELVIQDGAKYLENIHGAQFDAILIDCPDPSPESNVLYSREFFEHSVKPALNYDGVMAIQAGNVFIKEPFVRNLRYELTRLWSRPEYHYAPIPSYPSGGIGFYFVTDNPIFLPYVGIESLDTKYATRASLTGNIGVRPRSFDTNKRYKALDYYNKKYFNWFEGRTGVESECMARFLALEDEPNDSDGQHILMGLKQLSDSEQTWIHSLTLMTIDNLAKVQASAQRVLEEREIELPCKLPINGFTWHSVDNSLDIHFIGQVGDLWEYAPNLFSNAPSACFDEVRLTYHYYRDNLPCGISVTFSDLTFDYNRSIGGPSQIQRVRTNFASLKSRFFPRMLETIDKLGKQGIVLNRFDKSSDGTTLGCYFEVR